MMKGSYPFWWSSRCYYIAQTPLDKQNGYWEPVWSIVVEKMSGIIQIDDNWPIPARVRNLLIDFARRGGYAGMSPNEYLVSLGENAGPQPSWWSLVRSLDD